MIGIEYRKLHKQDKYSSYFYQQCASGVEIFSIQIVCHPYRIKRMTEGLVDCNGGCVSLSEGGSLICYKKDY